MHDHCGELQLGARADPNHQTSSSNLHPGLFIIKISVFPYKLYKLLAYVRLDNDGAD